MSPIVEEISPEEAHKQLQADPKVLLLDVRTPAEFEQAHVEGSLLIPVQDLMGELSQLAPHKTDPILVICRSGHRSHDAVTLLKSNGFEQAFNVSGGVMNWYQVGLPLTIKN